MTYPMNILPHHKLMYSGNVMMVAQQLRNPLMGAVTEMSATGEAQDAADLFSKVDYVRDNARSRRNLEVNIGRDRRWLVRPDDFIKAAGYIDRVERFDTAFDPTSMYVRTYTAAVTRGWCDTLLGLERTPGGPATVTGAGILGVSRSGKTPGANVNLPSAQYVPHGSTGLTIAKIREAKLELKKADFGLEDNDPFYAAITPQQEDDLLGAAQATGENLSDFTISQLRSGKPVPLLGITWIVTNLLPLNANGDRLCPVWAKSNVVAGVWQPITGETWNDPHADNLPYVKVSAMLDCTRLQDNGVIVIECDEPA